MSIQEAPRPLICLTIFPDAIPTMVACIFSANRLPEGVGPMENVLMAVLGIRAGSRVCHRTPVEQGGSRVAPLLHMRDCALRLGVGDKES